MNSKIVNYVPKNKQVKSTSRMEREKMERLLKNHIDDLIREKNKKNYQSRYEYDLEIKELKEHEKSSLIDALYNLDPIVKEILDDYMQGVINERLGWVEAEDNYDRGLTPASDGHGSIQWVRR